MVALTAFPFLGQSSRALFKHLEHSFSLENRESLQTSEPDIVRLSWAKLVHAFTGQTDITFAYARAEQPSGLELTTRHVELLPTTSLAQAAKELASAAAIGPATPLDSVPSILIEATRHTSDGEPLISTIPLRVQFHVDASLPSSLQFHFKATFDTTLLTSFHVASLLGHLEFYIHLIAKGDAKLAVVELPHLSPSDGEKFAQWNATPQNLVSDTIHGMVDKISQNHPHDTAIDAWDGSMTYNELDTASNTLVQLLLEKDVGVGDTVAIMMPKSIQVPIAMLAVLKSGAAFIVFDRKLPLKRLESMQMVAGCRHAIVSSGNVGLASRLFENVSVVCDDETIKHVERNGNSGLQNNGSRSKPSSHDVAFLIFTSGSSGVPKAVQIQHYAWCSTYSGQQNSFGIEKKTRVLQLSSFNFVLSCLEILATLMIGGTVCIPGEDEQRNDLAGAIRRLRPDWVSMTPSLAGIYRPEDFTGIKTLVLVGELISNSVIKAWTSSNELKLLNGYGQSEACSMNSTAAIDGEATVGRNIGRGTWLRYWIVDPLNHDQLAPVGAVGELLVEGYAIAKGYRNDDENTKDKFINNPAWADEMRAGLDGRRFYKTGDLVQYQEDGSLCLYGRKDAQLKIHGQRMEAAEVEHHIMTQFGNEVSHVTVEKTTLTTPNGHPTEQLTAYIVLEEELMGQLSDGKDVASGRSVDLRQDGRMQQHLLDFRDRVRSRLSQILPSWMLPTSIALLRTTPKTATGKLSRRLLLEQEILCSTDDILLHKRGCSDKGDQTTSQDKTTLSPELGLLSQIWAQSINVDTSDIHPDQKWADLGGDSLSAMSFVNKARKAGFQITFSDVYSGRSLAELAEATRTGGFADLRIMSISDSQYAQTNGLNELPLTDFQAHCINTTFHSSQTLVYTYNIRFRGRFDSKRLERALGELVKNTDSLRLYFDIDRPSQRTQSVQAWTDATMPAIFIETQNADDTEKKRSEIKQPVFAKITKDAQSSDIWLFLRLHHAVFDGTSWKLLLDDLSSAYARDAPLNARPPYLTYLRNRLLHRPPAALDYWRRLFAGSSPTLLRVPQATLTAGTGPFSDTARSGVVFLGTRSPPAGATMSTLLKGAWAIVLSHMANTNDVIFEYLVHGRDDSIAEAQHVIGCCVSNIPCRLQIDDQTTAPDLLSSAGQQILASIPHANVGSTTVARECTDWSFDGHIYHYSSWMLHQNIDVLKHVGVGEAGYMDVPEPVFGGSVVSDFAVITVPYGSQAVKILLLAHTALYSAVEIQAVWKAFLFCIHSLLDGQQVGWIKRELAAIDDLPSRRTV